MPRVIRTAALLLGGVATSAMAQQGARLGGSVSDSTGRPLAAQVVVQRDTAIVLRTLDGRFSALDVQPGRARVRVRALGFVARDTVVDVVAPETVLHLVLTRVPVRLDTVRVSGARCRPVSFEGFACRGQTARGIFLTIEEIDAARERYVGGLFQNLDGFQVEPVKGERRLMPRATSGWHCLTEIVDGRHVTLANPIPIDPKALIGVEVYARADDVPPEYQRYAWKDGMRCSLVVYWTTQGRKRR